ncbi:MAG TPA: alpha/beta hydrolase [Chloroflexota bacterium]|nr:alpha/beta hydrolase [Chloroflexota bacterium]
MATLRVPGTELYYDERGKGIPILWLQGLGADHSAWGPQLARFSSRFQCLAPDNRGAGRTAPGGPISLRGMAEDAAALLAARAGDQSAHVVGLSMGASIALELARLAPERVRSLVLVSASAAIEPRLRELMLAWRAIYPAVSPAVFQRQANLWLFSWRFFERPNAAAAVIRYAERSAAPVEWFTAQLDAAISHDAAGGLSELSIPSLVITGEEDIMVPPRMGQALADLLPDARFVVIPQAGHSVNLEQQAPFHQAITRFLDEH